MEYKIETTQEMDKELGELWEDIKVTDENNNYILFRRHTCLGHSKYKMHDGIILGTKFYYNDNSGFTKMGKGKIKKEVEQIKNQIIDWVYNNNILKIML